MYKTKIKNFTFEALLSFWLDLYNKPQVCMCTPPFWTPVPPPSQPYSPGLSKSISLGCPASCTELKLVIYFSHGNVHVSMPFSQSPHPCLLPLTPKVCSLSLCLLCCPEPPSLVVQLVKNLPATEGDTETKFQSLGWEDPLAKGMATLSSIMPGKPHGQRKLVGCSPGVAKSWKGLSD